MTVSSVSDSTILNDYIAKQTAATTATTTTSSAKSTLVGNYDTFLKILTAQLKNQDPTAPMDASKFTEQLVQYSSVEQQIATNDKLDSMLKALNSNGITPLLSYVGQYTESKTTENLVVQGGQALMAYTLPSAAQSVSISVQDSSGNSIATIDGPTTKGLNRVAWDGTLSDGTTAADGVYKFVLTAKDSSGTALTVDDKRVIGQITGLETGTDGTVKLKIGSMDVKDTDILSVFGSVTAKSDTTSSDDAASS